jgi:hypothetical protein
MTTNDKHRCEKTAAWLLRLDALSHLMAAMIVFLPDATIVWVHTRLGLGVFPDAPIAWYLARGLSAYYAMHGALMLFISLDVVRYLDLVRIAMRLFAVYGILMLIVDLQAPMPTFWTIAEPAFILVFSAIVLALLSSSSSNQNER